MAGLGQTMHTEDVQAIIKIIEAGQDITAIIEVVMGIVPEASKGMVDLIIITIIEGEVIETKTMIGIGVGHMKDRIGTEEIVET